MILEEETKESFGYLSSELSPKSCKPIIAACELCGKFRITTKHDYRTFCISCRWKSRKSPRFGKHLSEETKAKMSAANKGKKNYNYNGGKKVARARHNAKRKRDLGYELLMPLKEGEVGHHVTDVHVIGISKEVHTYFGGHKRQRHRTCVLQWLKTNDKKKYNLVLCILAKESVYNQIV